MNSWSDLLALLKSQAELEDVIKEVRQATKNDFFMQEYENMLTLTLFRCTQNLDTIEIRFLARLIQLIDAVFPKLPSNRDKILTYLHIITEIKHIPKLSHVCEDAQEIISKYTTNANQEFCLQSILRVYKKVQLEGSDMIKANSPLALESDEFKNSFRSGALFGQYLYNQNELGIDFKCCQLFVRKALLVCIKLDYHSFLNGFEYYVLNEIVGIFKFQKKVINKYLQVIADEYFNVFEICVENNLLLSKNMIYALTDLFLFHYSEQQEEFDNICTNEINTIIRFVIVYEHLFDIQEVVLIFTILHSKLLELKHIALRLLLLFPCKECCEKLFSAIFNNLDEHGEKAELLGTLIQSNINKEFIDILLNPNLIGNYRNELVLDFLNKNKLQPEQIQEIKERNTRINNEFSQIYSALSNKDLYEYANEALPQEMAYIIFELINRKVTYWEVIKGCRSELLQVVISEYKEFFPSK